MISFFFLLITSIWVPVGDSYEQIPIIYGEIKVCGGYSAAQGDFIKGCNHKQNGEWYLQFDPRFVHEPELMGTVWSHEILHAWGWSHAQMEWWAVEGKYR